MGDDPINVSKKPRSNIILESLLHIFDPQNWKLITPIWFEWLGWFLSLGALGYVAQKTNNIGLEVIYGISYIAFFMFIATTIGDINRMKLISNKIVNNIVTLLLSLIVYWITNLILNQAIKELLVTTN